MERGFASLPKHISSLVLLLFLFASIGSIGNSLFLSPTAAEAQIAQKPILHRHHPLVREAIEVQNRHSHRLFDIPDVVGTGVGVGLDGLPVIKVFTKRAGVRGVPEWLESTPVHVEVTGMVVALSDPTSRFARPVPIGVSTGHPDITAGTIGARVIDANGNVYALSNNHVYANQNEALPNDPVLQPGPYDGGVSSGDQIGTLSDFQVINFSFSGENYIDAAIALSTVGELGNSTPTDDGYGTPSSEIKEAYVGMPVQKYGRTTGLTTGNVGAVNVYVEVCYEQFWILCIKSAYFYDQIQISTAGFSEGGDSGSLIVTNDGAKNPVGLLFAGSDTTTFANRIARVLERFQVSVDGGTVPTTPPDAPSDLSATAVSATQINLAWADNANNESGFKIERCQGPGCTNFAQIAIVGANVKSYSDPGLLASTTYAYRILAYNAGGDSSPSNEASAKTLNVTLPPTAPGSLTAKAVSRSQINLSWADNSNNEDGFKIERCQGSSCTNFVQIATVGANARSYSDTGLRRRTWYRYRIRGYNAGGNSAYSIPASARTTW